MALEDAAEIGVVDGHAEVGTQKLLAQKSLSEVLLGLGVVVERHVDIAESIEGDDARLDGGWEVGRESLGDLESLIVKIGGLGHEPYTSVYRAQIIERLGNEKRIGESLCGFERDIVSLDGLCETAGIAARLA